MNEEPVQTPPQETSSSGIDDNSQRSGEDWEPEGASPDPSIRTACRTMHSRIRSRCPGRRMTACWTRTLTALPGHGNHKKRRSPWRGNGVVRRGWAVSSSAETAANVDEDPIVFAHQAESRRLRRRSVAVWQLAQRITHRPGLMQRQHPLGPTDIQHTHEHPPAFFLRQLRFEFGSQLIRSRRLHLPVRGTFQLAAFAKPKHQIDAMA